MKARGETPLFVVTLGAFTVGLCATLWLASRLGLGEASASEPRFAVDARVSAPAASALTPPPLAGSSAPAPAEIAAAASPDSLAAWYEDLRDRGLLLPVEGVEAAELRDHFFDARADHVHHAIDILAPRDTPVRAVEDGTIARLWLSNGGGGIAVYQLDPSRRFAYYYAHLERWAEDLAEGEPVMRGQVIGYVGTSGNAPPGTPHLHFAISRLGSDGRWWGGAPLNPFLVYRP